ncbi:hypothetical protein JL09_g6801 [Pichia kudriavzevii]|uniref:Uncharacterized protein n=1 Tax=Pichia kudriavzevii TaxID=4909 RepID=A0A099NKW8_PICKU|nr:hypothetical protein JL09_g6802 [Pichia kudriavzevii]KGK32592.1 hypothetical protein JL09_g6801 [Pichia kudriavzevii]
MSQTKFWS